MQFPEIIDLDDEEEDEIGDPEAPTIIIIDENEDEGPPEGINDVDDTSTAVILRNHILVLEQHLATLRATAWLDGTAIEH